MRWVYWTQRAVATLQCQGTVCAHSAPVNISIAFTISFHLCHCTVNVTHWLHQWKWMQFWCCDSTACAAAPSFTHSATHLQRICLSKDSLVSALVLFRTMSSTRFFKGSIQNRSMLKWFFARMKNVLHMILCRTQQNNSRTISIHILHQSDVRFHHAQRHLSITLFYI